MKKSLNKFLFLLLMLILPLSGCWDYRETDSLAIIVGLAVDKGVNHKYLVTAEIVNFKLGTASESGEIESKLISGEGNSIFAAMRNAYTVLDRQPYVSHIEVFVISQDVARDGILPIIDLSSRALRIRTSLAVLISKEKTAQQVLAAQSVGQPIKSFQIADEFLVQRKSLSTAMKVEAYQVVNAIGSEGIALVLPTAGLKVNNGQTEIELSGTALFKKDRLVGLLNGEESKYVLFIRDKLHDGVLVENMAGKDKPAIISFKIKKSHTKVKPVVIKGKLRMQISVITKVDLWELDTTKDYISESGRKLLKRHAESILRENILRVVHKVQQDYDADIFGFGNLVYSQMPDLWRKIKPHWGKIFKQLPVEVQTEIEIEGSGMALKPLSVEG